jgi:hypothetical protein
MPQVFLHWEKISKAILENVFFLYFERFLPYLGLGLKIGKMALLSGEIFFLEMLLTK